MHNATFLDAGRRAGLVYLVVVVTGIVSLAYVPSQLIVRGDAVATLDRIIASEPLFRAGIAAGFACYLAFLVRPLALFEVLAPVHRRAAWLMVVLGVAGVPVSLGALQHKLDVLTLLQEAAGPGGLARAELASAVAAALARYGQGILVAELFWGVWLFPLGYLIFRSRQVPKVLGVLLMLGCVGYLTDVFATVLWPAYPTSALNQWVTRPAALGEIGTCLWLLVRGARPEPAREA